MPGHPLRSLKKLKVHPSDARRRGEALAQVEGPIRRVGPARAARLASRSGCARAHTQVSEGLGRGGQTERCYTKAISSHPVTPQTALSVIMHHAVRRYSMSRLIVSRSVAVLGNWFAKELVRSATSSVAASAGALPRLHIFAHAGVAVAVRLSSDRVNASGPPRYR